MATVVSQRSSFVVSTDSLQPHRARIGRPYRRHSLRVQVCSRPKRSKLTSSPGRTFANDEGGDDPSRVGAATNPLIEGSSASAFSLDISFKDGRSGISKTLQNAAARVSTKAGDKTLSVAFASIATTCDQINLPRTVADSAKQLFRRQDEEKICRGKSREAIEGACIFIACRLAGVARTFKEIQHLTQVDKKKLAECFKLLQAAFAPTAAADQATGDTSGLQVASSAAHQVSRFCNHLGLPVFVEAVSKAVCIKVLDLGTLAGRSPITVAGAAIYFASHLIGMPKTANEVASVAGMADGTLRMAYRCACPALF